VRGVRADREAYCADCGIGTLTAGEWYAVKNEIWKVAWNARPQPSARENLAEETLPPVQPLLPGLHLPEPEGEQILCIGCLEQRIGRTLTCRDFADALINGLPGKSGRLQSRLTAKRSKSVRGLGPRLTRSPS
jgi:hypothetical protein